MGLYMGELIWSGGGGAYTWRHFSLMETDVKVQTLMNFCIYILPLRPKATQKFFRDAFPL